MFSTFLGLTSSPYVLPCRLPLLVPTPCQLPLLPPTACQLHLEASSTSEVSSTVQPRKVCLSSVLLSSTRSCRLLIRADYSFMSTTSPLVDYSLYQHLLEIQSAVQNIFNERGMDRGYLGNVGRHTVMLFGTVDPKRPVVAILAMHPRSQDSSWRAIGCSIVSRTLRTFDPAT